MGEGSERPKCIDALRAARGLPAASTVQTTACLKAMPEQTGLEGNGEDFTDRSNGQMCAAMPMGLAAMRRGVEGRPLLRSNAR